MALDTSRVFEDPLTVKPEVEGEILGEVFADESFPEVPPEYMRDERWKCLWRAPVAHREPVHLIEARSILGAVKHRARDHHRHGKRIVIFNDNMSVVLACQKGRCASYPLLRLLRRISAHGIACGLRFYVRWVPSERNAADKDSRAFEKGRGEQAPFGKKVRQGLYEERGREGKPEDEEQESFASHSKEEEEPLARKASQEYARHRAGQASHEEGGGAPPESENTTEQAFEEAAGAGRGDDRPGACQCSEEHAGGLLEEAERILRLRRLPPPKPKKPGRLGQSIGGLQRHHVPQWGGQSCRRQAQGCFRVSETRRGEDRKAGASPFQAGTQRMAKVGAHTSAPAHVRVPQVSGERGATPDGKEEHGSVQRSNLQHIRTTRRASPSVPSRHCAQERHLRLRCDNPGCHGEGHCKQGRNLRRDAHPGRQESAVVGRSDGEVEPTEDARSKGARVIVGIQRAGVPGGVEACSGNLGNRGGSTKPVPKPTRRSKQRPTAETEESRQCISPREMGIRQQCASVQQTWKAAADLKPVQQGVGAIWGRCSEAFQGLLPKWYPKAPEEAGEEVLRESVKSNAAQNLHGKFFLSLFGGVGNHAKFWAHHGGLAAVVDFEDYSCNDLSKHSAWNSVLSDLDTVDVLGIDLPCNTFSRARRAPPWSKLPKPLRSQEHIFGLPNLNSSDFARVSRANTMLHGAIRCIRRCLKRNIPGFLENPSNSWVWQVPAIQRLIRHPAVHLIRVDQCQYNQQWRKPTKLLFWNVCPAHLKVCSGKGRCSRTNRAHLQLTGLVGKRFLTQHAQVYTKEFAAALMQSFMHPPPPPSMGHF